MPEPETLSVTLPECVVEPSRDAEEFQDAEAAAEVLAREVGEGEGDRVTEKAGLREELAEPPLLLAEVRGEWEGVTVPVSVSVPAGDREKATEGVDALLDTGDVEAAADTLAMEGEKCGVDVAQPERLRVKFAVAEAALLSRGEELGKSVGDCAAVSEALGVEVTVSVLAAESERWAVELEELRRVTVPVGEMLWEGEGASEAVAAGLLVAAALCVGVAVEMLVGVMVSVAGENVGVLVEEAATLSLPARDGEAEGEDGAEAEDCAVVVAQGVEDAVPPAVADASAVPVVAAEREAVLEGSGEPLRAALAVGETVGVEE